MVLPDGIVLTSEADLGPLASWESSGGTFLAPGRLDDFNGIKKYGI